ncbi:MULTISPECIES: fimbria/pilus outer membrane usher protein [Novosphingobium]|uniref:fimbria/pilus outer membrane usher protein n=1 Tax=Novosphingobium sp. TaxID=1874826 RepID=UPI0012C0C694|nr:fimbria/pilus outer membrane usher protein [Novosphingobium sp.]MPS70788.1 fimbrial biogenesis outer membrane usher protein [Novosphingobium sp.]
MARRSRYRPAWTAFAVAACLCGTAAEAQQGETPMPVGIVLNGRDLQRLGLVVVDGERIFVRVSDLREWGIVTAFRTEVQIEGESYLEIGSEQDISGRLDPDGANLLLDVDPAHLPETRIGASERAVPVAEAVPVAFIDYDLHFTRQKRDNFVSAVVDAGVSGPWGVAGTSALAESTRSSVTRLDSTFVRDFPEQNQRLSVGDTFTRGSAWSQSARFGGIRFGTDFSLDPARITYPLPSVSGSALLPSTVELASRAASQSLAVEPGRFAFDYRPRFTGAGEVTMIVRDIAGNERTVSRSFYSSTALLRPGLSEFSLEAGALREDYGYRSFAYGEAFAAAFYRRGLTPVLTLEGRAEGSGRTRMAGGAATLVIQPIGEMRLSAAASHGETGHGRLYQVQFQRLTPGYSITASYRAADAGFRQVGDNVREREARRELAVSGSLVLGRLGGLNASYLRIVEGRRHQSISSVGYSTNVGRVFLSLGAQRFDSDDGTVTSGFASLTLPLGQGRHVGFYADQESAAATYEKAAPSGRGLGYRAASGYEDDRGVWVEGAATLRAAAGQLDIAAARRGGDIMARLEARGALVVTGGGLVATPSVDNALAVVEVPGSSAVGVMLENQPIARRAGGGRLAVVTGLQPYVANRISIDPSELPISGELGAAEQVVAPGWRQAARVSFGSREVHPVRLRLVDEGGSPLPPGLVVTGREGDAMFTGYDGEVFLADYQARAILTVERAGGSRCRVLLPSSAPADALATPLAVTCTAVPSKAGE